RVSTKRRIKAFGGFSVLENRPADDLLFGRLIAEQGCEVVLLPYLVKTVADFKGLGELVAKRLRWMTVMRSMRPWGHFGLLFTWGLVWALLAVTFHPSIGIAAGFLGTYLLTRWASTLLMGGWGLRQKSMWRKLPLVPLWDLFAFGIWLASFTQNTIRWRGVDYRIRDGHFDKAASPRSASAATSHT